VLERLRNSPGITATSIMPLPFSGDDWGASFSIEGRPQLPGDPGPHGSIRFVSPDYFSVMGIPLRAGRDFTQAEAGKTISAAIIDEKLAAQYWPNENPIGKHMRNGRDQPWATIVGVAAAIRHNELATESNKGVYYFPTYQSPPPLTAFVVKGPQAAAAIRAAVRSTDPAQPVFDVKTMDDRIATSLGPRRFAVRLLGGFAVIALLMAAIGLYGMISYAVAQRTQEIGIRMALGAQQSEVLSLILGHGMRLAFAGVAIGLIGSALLTKVVASQLYQVSRFDPLTLAATALALIAVAALASYLPARRAMRVDPMIALRYE
jgi:predicted permease